MAQELPPLWHIGIVVSDFKAAAGQLEARWDAEVEDQMEMQFPSAIYEGSEASFSAQFGFVRTGATELELIQPLTGRSPYADFLDRNEGDGIHHLAYMVDDVESYLVGFDKDPDVKVIVDSPAGEDGRFVYLEGALPGPCTELITIPSAVRSLVKIPGQ